MKCLSVVIFLKDGKILNTRLISQAHKQIRFLFFFFYLFVFNSCGSCEVINLMKETKRERESV